MICPTSFCRLLAGPSSASWKALNRRRISLWSSLSRTMASVDTGMTSLKSLGWWGSGTPTPNAENR